MLGGCFQNPGPLQSNRGRPLQDVDSSQNGNTGKMSSSGFVFVFIGADELSQIMTKACKTREEPEPEQMGKKHHSPRETDHMSNSDKGAS